MAREQFSKPEESQRERDRKAVLQIQYVLLGALVGSMVGSADINILLKAGAGVVLFLSIILVNRRWDRIHGLLR